MAPRSSLIVTDEALSSETGKGTDFVVLLSGEPQGGIKIRRRVRERIQLRAPSASLFGARLSEVRLRPGEPASKSAGDLVRLTGAPAAHQL